MTYAELTREQRLELKQPMLQEIMDGEATRDELLAADELVSDADCMREYGNEFSPSDFACTYGGRA